MKHGLSTILDHTAILIVGIGASLFHYYFETSVRGPHVNIYITVAIILMISIFTQYLVNSINASRRALWQANETLEQKVRDRTEELRNSELKYRTIFENTGAATIIIERDQKISLANWRFLTLSGYGRSEVQHRALWTQFIDEKSYRKMIADENTGIAGIPAGHGRDFECQFLDKRANRRSILISFARIPETDSSVASITDITDLKDAEQRIYFQAFHDALTRLPNRALFVEHLQMAIKRAKRRPDYRFAVIYLDIDRFKLVNDSLGHGAGDDLLVAFADRIRESLRDTDILARLGGDEFVVLLEDIDDLAYAENIADRLQKALRRPFQIKGMEVFAPASFGVVIDTRSYDEPDAIIRDADAAMYHAKESGRCQVKMFDKTLHEKAQHLLQQETDLRKAVQGDQFENHYQPIVRLSTGEVWRRWPSVRTR